MEEEATQPSTQPLPGHEGIAPSSGNYLSGVICLLHPSSPAAYETVERLSKVEPCHVFKTTDAAPNRTPPNVGGGAGIRGANEDEDEEYLATQLASPGQYYCEEGLDIALRTDPGPKQPDLGFLFGRDARRCDVVIGDSIKTRRVVSNSHFRIYRNPNNVLMLEDHSTNGTWVDNTKIGGNPSDHDNGTTHALFAGSIIVVAPGAAILRFVVRIPNQSGSGLCPSKPPPATLNHGAGIDPGLPPPGPPARLPQLNLAPRPLRNQAAIDRRPGPRTHGLKAHQMHTSVVLEKDPGWHGGGTYKIGEIIGSGAFATVRRAVLWKTGDVFAVKIIQRRTVASHATSIKKEVEILEKMNHPHIVSCKEYHEDDKNLYIVMEYVGGGDLSEYLKHKRVMREDQVKEVSRQVLRGIEYVHGMGISHRDLKPDNILMVTEEPLVVKISDFGLAKMVLSEETFLRTFCGTMLYLAPEVYPAYATAGVAGAGSVKRKRHPKEDAGREGGRNDKQKKRYNQAVDMWSFGCVVHMLLTGKTPFEGKNADDMLRIILKGFVSPRLLEATLGRDCDDVKDFIGRLLQVDPAMRMHEQEALRHDWLGDGSDVSSTGQGDDEEFQLVSHEDAQDMSVSDDLAGRDERTAEISRKVPVGPVRKSNSEPKLGKALLGTVSQMSLDQSDSRMSTGEEGNSVNDIFRSLDAESHTSGSKMFRRPPEASVRRSSGVFPSAGHSVYSNAEESHDSGSRIFGMPPKVPIPEDPGRSMYSTAAESMPLPNNGVPSRDKELFQIDSLSELQHASPAVAGSDPQDTRTQGSDGSLAAAEVMVGNLKVASPSLHETPSPHTSLNSGKQNGNSVDIFNASSFDDPVVVYSTPRSLAGHQGLVPPTPRRSSNPENRAPLSQPCNVQQQVEVGNFVKPSTPWGRLVPVSGTIAPTTISLNQQMITIGRSSTCTHTLQDLRISKAHFAIQLADPTLQIQPEDDGIWHPKPNMIAWFKIAGTNGCFLNGRKKRKGTIGRVYDGDVVHLIKEEKDGQMEFVGYRCEFNVGVHLRQHMEVSDEDMSVRQKADIAAHGLSMGVSMATTMAIATFARGNDSVEMV